MGEAKELGEESWRRKRKGRKEEGEMPHLMTANQRNINKIENSGQNGGKLTNSTNIHTYNGISEPGEGRMWGRDGIGAGHGG